VGARRWVEGCMYVCMYVCLWAEKVERACCWTTVYRVRHAFTTSYLFRSYLFGSIPEHGFIFF
jgi:hypothetical protein